MIFFLVPTVGDDGVASVAINPMGLRRRYESLLSVGYVPRQRRCDSLLLQAQAGPLLCNHYDLKL